MKRKTISAFDFVEQVIAKIIAKKEEGKKLKLNHGEHYDLIVNPFIYENADGCS